MIITACLAGVASAAEADTSWYDDSASTFTLTDAADLFGFAQLVNNGNSFSGKTVTLGGNINLNNEEWTPIGNSSSTYFSGTFDGKSHTVSGLSITQDGTGYYGFFGYTDASAKISNLVVDGVIQVTSENTGQTVCAGGLVAWNGGDIEKSASSVSVDVAGYRGRIGGLVGYNVGDIANCYAVGDVVGNTYASSGSDAVGIGGLVGYNAANVTNCFAAGDVTLTWVPSKQTGAGHAGGLVGLHQPASGVQGKLMNSYAVGTVTAPTTYSGVGGLVGSAYTSRSVISGNYALNEVVGDGLYNYGTNAGRICGFLATQVTSINDNHAWKSMSVAGSVVSGGTADNKDGADVTSDAVWNKVDGFGPFIDANGWKLNSGNALFLLPVLKDLPAPANAEAVHLNPADLWRITFSANGGQGSMPAGIVEKGQTFTIPENTYTKRDYTFSGWNTEADGSGTSYVPGESITPTKDMPLYAQWLWNNCTIKFVLNTNDAIGSGGSMLDKVVVRGTSCTLPPCGFEYQHYSFAGWAESPTGAIVYENEATISVVNSDMTLYAKWTPVKYTVTFNANGGTPVPEEQEVEYNSLAAEPTPSPEKTGYLFDGWYQDDVTFSDKWEFATGNVQFSISLYAHWKPISYTVLFNNNTGAGVMANQEFKYEVSRELYPNSFTAPSGKEFAGWNTEADGSGDSYPADYSASKMTTENGYEITLYAQWKDIVSDDDDSDYDYDYDYDDYEPSTPSTPTTPTTPTTPEVPVTPEVPDVPETPETPEEPEQPTDEPETPAETPAPILGMVLGGLAAAVVLRRK